MNIHAHPGPKFFEMICCQCRKTYYIHGKAPDLYADSYFCSYCGSTEGLDTIENLEQARVLTIFTRDPNPSEKGKEGIKVIKALLDDFYPEFRKRLRNFQDRLLTLSDEEVIKSFEDLFGTTEYLEWMLDVQEISPGFVEACLEKERK